MNGSTSLRRAFAAATTAAVVAAFASAAAGQSTNASTNAGTSSASRNTSNDTSTRVRARADVVNGGVTQEEADQLRALAPSYPLEIQFARAADGAFAADVQVRVVDASGRPVLMLYAAEPILLANLPPGRYTVEATYEGETKRQQVTLGRGHQKLGFAW